MKRLRSAALLLLIPGLMASCASVKRCAYAGSDRNDWQQPERVVDFLGLEPGDRVADLGAGGGYFTFELAEAVGPGGKVYAVDVDGEMLEYLRDEALARGAANVETVRAQQESPALPEAVDLIFISNTYHHLADRPNYFARAKQSLRPGGRIAIVEFDGRSGGFFSLFSDHSTLPDVVKAEMKEAGYRLDEEPDFLERQSFLIFEALPTDGSAAK